uniref:Histone H1 n=1 Tax=Myripristis murdjan TaxID=586833 RepID=A0A667XNU0_9TELE
MSLHGPHGLYNLRPPLRPQHQSSPTQFAVHRPDEREDRMAEVAPAPAAAAPAKAPKKKSVRPKKSGPSVGELIVKAVSASKERGGVSLAALKKALAAGGYDVEKNKARVRLAVKSLVTKGTLLQTKGTGASGSFKLNKKVKELCWAPSVSRLNSVIKSEIHH